MYELIFRLVQLYTVHIATHQMTIIVCVRSAPEWDSYLDYALVGMPQRIDSNPRAEIEELAPIHVPDVRPLPMGQD